MAEKKGPGTLRINIIWHSSEKLLRLVIAFLVGIWLARYLGPEQFGSYNYVMAWLGMFNAIAWLGVGEVIMRDMIRDRDDEGSILGSAFLIRLCGSFLAIASALGVAYWFGEFSHTQLLLLAILSIGVPFAEIPAGIWMWFASHTNVGPVVMGKNLSMVIGALLKLSVILTGAGLIALVTAVTMESVLLCACLFGAYFYYGERLSKWQFNSKHAWRMLVSGLPIMLSGLVVSLNARVDQLLLGRLTSMAEVGIYAAAMRLSEIWWIVPPMLMQTLAARYIYPKDLDEKLEVNVARLVAGMALLAMVPCLIISLVGANTIAIIFGDKYIEAGDVLVIHIWMAVLVFIDAPLNQYLLATNRQSHLIIKSLVALILNVGLGWLFIPHYGPVGAASATLIAQAVVVLVMPVIYPPFRNLRSIFGLSFRQIPFFISLTRRFLLKYLG